MAVVGPALVLVGAELAHLLAARTCATQLDPERPAALIVLGCPTSRRGRLTAAQRWRVDVAVRSLRCGRAGPVLAHPDTRVVFTGGARKRSRPEAEAMAASARRQGLPEDLIVLEERSHTTWENIEQALPLLDDPEQLAICSDALHAWRGRRYVRRQRPELAPRLVRARDYRPGEHPLLKLAAAAYEMPRLVWIRRRLLVTALQLHPTGR